MAAVIRSVPLQTFNSLAQDTSLDHKEQGSFSVINLLDQIDLRILIQHDDILIMAWLKDVKSLVQFSENLK